MINLYSSSTIGSYTTGKVTCTKNSATVTGTGTTWSEIVNPGDILTLDDDKFYIISAVNSNTSLTLDKNFAENTATNVSYRILLNTAAHFPSDTAAKVERALEQLSDINEAAINNDRTVTAATKLNGKGLTSTTGNLDLNPPTVNSNTGGQINFHYNQSSNATSSIYEDASGRIRLSGNVNITGKVLSNINLEGKQNPIRLYNMNPTTGAVQRFIQAYDDDGSTGVGSVVYTTYPEASEHNVRLRANNAGTYADLGVSVLSDGTKFTFAPTPATNDNSTKIATTAFVNNRLPYTTGTWTPVLKGSATAGAFTYTTQVGRYYRLGNLVFIMCKLVISGCTTYPTGTVQISGLPFKSYSYNNLNYHSINVGATGGVNSCLYRICGGYVPANNTHLVLMVNKKNSSDVGKSDYARWSSANDNDYNLQVGESETLSFHVTGWYTLTTS